MNILITGVNGFLGREITCKYLKKGNIKISGIARNSGDLPITYHEANILDMDRIENAFKEQAFDVVVHLAALTAHNQIVDNKFEALRINMTGTRNLLTAFNKYCNNALFVYASTGKVYGDTDQLPITEQALVKPMNALGKSKYITERLIDFYAQPNNKYLITRVFNIYGGRQKENFIVPTIIRQLKQGDTLTLGNINDKRDYLYIKDFINALTACIDRKDALSNLEVVNIGSGIPISAQDIINVFSRELQRDLQVITDPAKFRNDEKTEEYCDNSKLKQITGWQMEYTLEAAIGEICKETGLK